MGMESIVDSGGAPRGGYRVGSGLKPAPTSDKQPHCRDRSQFPRLEAKMKFGIFNIGDYHPQSSKPIPEYYDQILEQVEWAEKLGYDSYWFGEHHFDFFGVVPAPPLMMAAAAKRTKRSRIGVAGALLPYHNPITIAEEYAMVDILSRGRLDFGVGRGAPPERKGLGVTADGRGQSGGAARAQGLGRDRGRPRQSCRGARSRQDGVARRPNSVPGQVL